MTEKPYGHFAVIRFRNREGAVVEKTIRRRGTRGNIERAARATSCFIEIVRLEAYTQEEWERCRGIGRGEMTPGTTWRSMPG